MGFENLYLMINNLFPIIMLMVVIMVMLGLVEGIGGRRGRRGLLSIVIPLAFVFMLGAGGLVLPASAAASVTPGSTITQQSMPVDQYFRGLSTTDTYQLLEDGDTYVDGLTADSNGLIVITITPSEYGANSYTFEFANGTDVLTFTIQNKDVLDSLLPVFEIVIVVAILMFILTIFTGRRR